MCIIANEFNAALTDIKFGVRATDDLNKMKEFEVANFIQSDQHWTPTVNTLEKEVNKGWLTRN